MMDLFSQQMDVWNYHLPQEQTAKLIISQAQLHMFNWQTTNSMEQENTINA